MFGGVNLIREAGHGQSAFFMLEPDLAWDRVARATGAGFVLLSPAASGISGLHEGIGERTMEAKTIVKFAGDEGFEILDGIRGSFVMEADDDLPRLLLFREFDLHDGNFGAKRGG